MWLEKLNKLKKQSGMTINEISKLSKVPIGTLNKLFAGITQNPKLETIKAVVHSLGYTLDDIADDKDKLTPDVGYRDPDEKSLLTTYRQLTPPGKEDVRNFAEYTYSKEQQAITKEQITSTYNRKDFEYSTVGIATEPIAEYRIEYEVQLIGRVAGGYPIIAYEDKRDYIHTPVKADFALQIVGDSMEPDYPNLCYLLTKKEFDVIDGDVVVVSILRAAEIAEATCKKIYIQGDSVELRPINPIYPSQIYKTNEIKMEGKVVGKITA